MPGEKKTVAVDIERFVHTRNALNTAFMGLSSSIDKAVKAYIEHTQAVLDGDSSLDLSILITPFETLHTAAHVQQAISQAAGAAASEELDESGKKKRKRNYKPRDPNAPKRPLTAYFRYLKENRPLVAAEIAAGTREAGDVSKICTEKWNALSKEQQDAYREDYKREVIAYDQAVAEYKAAGGKMDDEEGAEAEAEVEPPAKKSAPAAAKDSAAGTPKPKAAPKKKAPAASTPAATTATPASTSKPKFSSINPNPASTAAETKTDAPKSATKRKGSAAAAKDADAAADGTPKAKRGRKSKADKEADAADTKDAKADAAPASAKKDAKKAAKKRKSEAAA